MCWCVDVGVFHCSRLFLTPSPLPNSPMTNLMTNAQWQKEVRPIPNKTISVTFINMSQQVPPKPRLSFWQMWNMSFGFFGIQFGFALQNANTSRIFETMGAKPESLAVLWLAAPITGLLIQPLIGFYSDRTWHPVWGRRRPYFTIGAILASLALCLMPNSSALCIKQQ